MPSIVHGVGAFLGVPAHPWRTPDAARLQDYIVSHIGILQNPKSPVVVISIDDQDPDFAVYLLSSLNGELDALLRAKALVRSSQYISYISEQLSHVTVAEHRFVLAQTLAEQERMRMMASSTLPYAADPFGMPTASLRPTTPKPLVVVGIALFMGLSLGATLATFRTHWQRNRFPRPTVLGDFSIRQPSI